MNAHNYKLAEPDPLSDHADEASAFGVESLASTIISKSRNLPAIRVQKDENGIMEEVVLSVESGNLRCVVYRSTAAASVKNSSCASLSPREQEIARMIAKGYPNKIIAAELDISPWTVGTHIRRIFSKVGTGSRAEMVAKLMEEGAMRPGQEMVRTNSGK
jgi:DNA-binding CsgD family transcriptional regulator